jgi:hypothetical protein
MNKKRIRAVLGGHFAKAIVEHLNNIGMLNSNGMPFTKDIVRNIIIGRTKRFEVIEAIAKFVLDTERREKELYESLK